MKENLYQYGCLMLNEYLGDLLSNICDFMGIAFIKEKYHNIYNWDYEANDPRGACIFRDKNDQDRFVFVDAPPQSDNTFVYFAVQCNQNEHEEIKSKLEKIIDAATKDDFPEGTKTNLSNIYGTDKDVYLRALKRYNVDYFE